MNRELEKQRLYWDNEIASFDSIYSHAKGTLGVVLDRVFRRDMYQRFEYAMAHAEPIEGRTFLDVGCGTGWYSLELARRNAKRVVGLDISEKMVRVCQARARQEGLADVLFEQGDLLHHDRSDRFDSCLGIGLFDYVRDPLPVLSKMRTCTTYAVILSFPRRWTWRAGIRKLRLALKRCNVRFYTLREVDQLLKQARFKSYDLEIVGQLFCVTAYV